MINNNKEAFLIAHDMLATAPSEEDFNNVKNLMLHLTSEMMTEDEAKACLKYLIDEINH